MKVYKWTALAVAISSAFPALAQIPQEQEKAQQDTYENNGELVIDSTDDCESCQ